MSEDVVDIETDMARLRSRAEAFSGRRGVRFVSQPNEMDCAAACLETVVRAYGKRAGLMRCRDLIQGGREGASLFDIQSGAEALGFECVGARVDFDQDLDSLPLPLIVGFEHHFVVVTGRRRGLAVLMDPAVGPSTVPLAELTEKSGGICLALAPTPAFQEWPDVTLDMSRYWRLAWDNRGYLLAALSCSLVVLALGAAGPWFGQYLFDTVIPTRDFDALAWVTWGYVAVVVLSRLGAVARLWVASLLSLRIDRHLSIAVYRRFFHMSLSDFQRRTAGDISGTLEEIGGIRQFITGQIVANLLQYVNFAVYFAMLLFISPKLALFAAIVAPAYAAIPWLLGPMLRRRRAIQVHRASRLETLLLEHIAGFRTLKTLRAERHAETRWTERLDGYLAQVQKSQRALFPLRTLADGFESLVSILSFVLAARWVITGEITVGEMVAGTLLVGQILGPVSAIAEHWTEFQELQVAVERVEDTLNQATEVDHGTSAEFVSGDVELRGVTYRYHPSQPPVLRELDLTFHAGEITAVVGRSGSGKTTVAQRLNRLLVPEAGLIRIGGVDTTELSLTALRGGVGVALPDHPLFQGSVLENIALGDPSVPDADRARSAARSAQIHDFIESLPSGYETHVPESGMGLSSGQKQRMALARLFYHDPPVMVFDEVTSHLDQVSERGILEALRAIQAKKAIVFITHRPSVLLYADRVVVLKDGVLARDVRLSGDDRRARAEAALDLFEGI